MAVTMLAERLTQSFRPASESRGLFLWSPPHAKNQATDMAKATQVTVENVNVPGHETNVNAEKYDAMKKVLLKVLPKGTPGLTQKQMMEAVKPHLPQDLWPGGAKSGWWVKTVQLDLEAKGLIRRTDTKPLQWYRST